VEVALRMKRIVSPASKNQSLSAEDEIRQLTKLNSNGSGFSFGTFGKAKNERLSDWI